MADYGGYGAIQREARDIDLREQSREVVDCPRCGMALVANSRGDKACRMGHYQAKTGQRP